MSGNVECETAAVRMPMQWQTEYTGSIDNRICTLTMPAGGGSEGKQGENH
jgi:hypothetical protein